MRIGIDIDEVLFKTSVMEHEYVLQQMYEEGYRYDEKGNLYLNDELFAEANSFAARRTYATFSRANIPSKCYTDSKWIDQELVKAIKSCIADHPDWEFVIITSRAAEDRFVYDSISRSQLKKINQIRSANKKMVQEVLPITKFYFTTDKAEYMLTYDIDVLVDDCIHYINDVERVDNKIPIWRLTNSFSREQLTQDKIDGLYVLNDFSRLQPILEEIERNLNASI